MSAGWPFTLKNYEGENIMSECATFTYKFNNLQDAERAAHVIKNWAEKELVNHEWVKQLFPVNETILFVGNNAAISWLEYDEKLSKLAEVIVQDNPDVLFTGEQSFLNSITGYEVTEEFEYNKGKVAYMYVTRCTYCGKSIPINAKDLYNVEEMSFCSKECAKAWMIDAILENPDCESEYDELEAMEINEVLELWEEYR